METALDHVQNQDFIEFSKAIKKELTNRIYQDPFVSAKKAEIEKYSKINALYKEVNKSNKDD